MKYLGIDFGTKRIGLATSDDAGEFAFPKAILKSDGHVIQEIIDVMEKEGISAIVIGSSVASNEAPNDVADQIEKFKKRLEEKVRVPLYMEREDFSSVEAHRYQTTAGSRDDSAAAIILQRFLDKKKK